MAAHLLISIVSPVYKAENIVDELIKRVIEEVSEITPDFEIILVEDGSPDNSWEKIEKACIANPKVVGVKLSRNFGQQNAITAGLEVSGGDYVVVIDCDLQDDPSHIVDFYNKITEGYDLVYAIKLWRKHGWLKNVLSSFFYFLFNWLIDDKRKQAVGSIGSYSMLSRKVVNAFLQVGDFHRHYLGVLRLLGFKAGYIEVKHQPRYEGKSSYNLARLVKLALDGIISQSDKLLRISISLGFFIVCLSFLGAISLIVYYIVHGSLAGYTSLMVMLLFSTGLILMSIGILGLYIGKIFDQVKGRPLYIIDKKING